MAEALQSAVVPKQDEVLMRCAMQHLEFPVDALAAHILQLPQDKMPSSS